MEYLSNSVSNFSTKKSLLNVIFGMKKHTKKYSSIKKKVSSDCAHKQKKLLRITPIVLMPRKIELNIQIINAESTMFEFSLLIE